MRKIVLLGLVAVFATVLFATESINSGLNILRVSDGTTFSSEKLKGAGDTVWTQTYDFNKGGLTGIMSLAFDVDTSAACSSKVSVLLREGNTDGDWDLLTVVATIDHALADWDTIIEVEFLPTMYWRLGFVDLNSNNDSLKLSNVYLFAIGQ